MALLDTNIETTLTADGNAPDDNGVEHHGGPLCLAVQGNFGSGTTVLQASLDGGTTWGTATDMITGDTLTEAVGTTNVVYAGVLNLPRCKVRVNLSGATSPDLDIRATRENGPQAR